MLSVGTWQAFVQDVVTTAYDLLAPPAGQAQGWYLVGRGQLELAIGRSGVLR